jgi:hypothetical protein
MNRLSKEPVERIFGEFMAVGVGGAAMRAVNTGINWISFRH